MNEFVEVSKAKELLRGLIKSAKSEVVALNDSLGKFISAPVFSPCKCLPSTIQEWMAMPSVGKIQEIAVRW